MNFLISEHLFDSVESITTKERNTFLRKISTAVAQGQTSFMIQEYIEINHKETDVYL